MTDSWDQLARVSGFWRKWRRVHQEENQIYFSDPVTCFTFDTLHRRRWSELHHKNQVGFYFNTHTHTHTSVGVSFN